jgi:hypothetical protein
MVNPSLILAHVNAQAETTSSSEDVRLNQCRKRLSGAKPPHELVEYKQWVLWRRERGRKVPYRINGRRASTTRGANWSEYHLVCRVLESHPKHYSGIGFVFSESDPFIGIDLDDCLEDTTGNPKRCVQGMLERFGDTYIEISPSGLGLKIWAKGKLPRSLEIALDDGCSLEMYDRARYFTLTGNVFRNAPLLIEDHANDILTLFEKLSGRDTNNRDLPKYHIAPEGKIPYGTQHNTLVSIAGTLRRRCLCDQAIEDCLQAVNRYQCEQPGPPEENLRALFTEALLISLVGGAVGVWSSTVLLGALSVWRPVPKYPLHVAANPDARVYAVALLLTLVSGFLFGAVPVRQVFRTDPYDVVKSGSRTTGRRRITMRRASAWNCIHLGDDHRSPVRLCSKKWSGSPVGIRTCNPSVYTDETSALFSARRCLPSVHSDAVKAPFASARLRRKGTKSAAYFSHICTSGARMRALGAQQRDVFQQ